MNVNQFLADGVAQLKALGFYADGVLDYELEGVRAHDVMDHLYWFGHPDTHIPTTWEGENQAIINMIARSTRKDPYGEEVFSAMCGHFNVSYEFYVKSVEYWGSNPWIDEYTAACKAA